MHAIGFIHEQSRPDRDRYVTVNWQNIKSGEENNFQKYSSSFVNTLNTPYDFGSIMHYGTHYWSKNGRPTLVPKQSGVSIGQSNGFSTLDLTRINRLYKC